MTTSAIDSKDCKLWYEEERVLASFTRRLIELAAVTNGRGLGGTLAAALNAMSLPAIAIDWDGYIVHMTAAADSVFDEDIKIKEGRVFLRDPTARCLLKEAIQKLKKPRQIPLAITPFIVPRRGKLPIVMRVWPFSAPESQPFQEAPSVLAILSLFPVLDEFQLPQYYM